VCSKTCVHCSVRTFQVCNRGCVPVRVTSSFTCNICIPDYEVFSNHDVVSGAPSALDVEAEVELNFKVDIENERRF
jgi:hypothetical protein